MLTLHTEVPKAEFIIFFLPEGLNYTSKMGSISSYKHHSSLRVIRSTA